MEKSRQCGVYGKCQKCEKYEYDQNPINISFDVIRYGAFGVFLWISRKWCEFWRMLRKFENQTFLQNDHFVAQNSQNGDVQNTV